MRREIPLALLGAIFLPSPALADDSDSRLQPNVSASSSQTTQPVSGVAALIAPTSADLVSAAIQPKLTGTQLRVSAVPGRLLRNQYNIVLSEAKFTVTTDSSTSLTNLALSLGYNPFALNSPHGRDVREKTLKRDACGKALNDAAVIVPKALEDAVPAAQRDLDVAAKNIEVASKTLDAAKEAFDSARLTHEVARALAAGERAGSPGLALAVKNREAAEGTRALAQGALDAAKRDLDAAKHARDAATVVLVKSQKALADAQEAKKRSDAKANDKLRECHSLRLAHEWTYLYSGWVPQVIGTVGFDVYPSGSGPDPLDKTGASVAKLEPWGGMKADVSTLFRPSERFDATFWGSYRYGRTSGAPHTNLTSYFGGGITLSWLALPFLTREQLNKSTDYVKSGFFPGMTIGVSGQTLTCAGRLDCDKLRTWQGSITPFIDFRASPLVQFRLSAPVTRFTAVGSAGTDVVPTFTVAAAVAAL